MWLQNLSLATEQPYVQRTFPHLSDYMLIVLDLEERLRNIWSIKFFNCPLSFVYFSTLKQKFQRELNLTRRIGAGYRCNFAKVGIAE